MSLLHLSSPPKHGARRPAFHDAHAADLHARLRARAAAPGEAPEARVHLPTRGPNGMWLLCC